MAVINQLLDLSKLESRSIKLDSALFDLEMMLFDIAEQTKKRINENVSFKLNLIQFRVASRATDTHSADSGEPARQCRKVHSRRCR